MSQTPLRALIASVLIMASASAQTGHIYYGGPPSGVITNTIICSPSCAPLVPQQPVAPSYPTAALTVLPPVTRLSPLGGEALDQDSNREYVSDGPSIVIQQFHPLYDGSKPCTSVGLCAPLGGGGFGPGQMGPLSFFRPTVAGHTFGDITGMAIVPTYICQKMLLVTDGSYVMGLRPCPDTLTGWTSAGIVHAPFAAPPTPWPLSGLEPGPLGTFIACDSAGGSYAISIPGCSSLPPGLISSWPPPSTIPPGAVITGNIYDRSLGSGNQSLYVTDGSWLYPVFSPCGLAPILLSPPPGLVPRGASFSAEPTVLQGTPGSYSSLVLGTTQPIVGGKSLFITLDGTSSAANLPGGIIYGPCTTTQMFTDCSGSNLWIDVLMFDYILSVTDSAGQVCLPVSVPSVPLTIYLQGFVIDPSTCSVPPYVRLSDALHCRVSDY